MLASSEANWSGSTLLAEYIRVQQDKVNSGVAYFHVVLTEEFYCIFFFKIDACRQQSLRIQLFFFFCLALGNSEQIFRVDMA